LKKQHWKSKLKKTALEKETRNNSIGKGNLKEQPWKRKL
jgi:hypothetical protein